MSFGAIFETTLAWITVVPAMSSHLISGCTLQVAAHDRFISMINYKSVYKYVPYSQDLNTVALS
jgi:hypothetical protein